MPVEIDELTTEVFVEPGTAAGPGAAPSQPASPWQAVDAFRAMRERLARIAERTRAEAYDD
jgi:hypothetical protein